MTALVSEAAHAFAFGPFLLVPERQQLLKDQEPLRVGGRALDLLTALVERHGEVVSKRELIGRVWPGLVVEEGNLKVNIAALRRLLGDGADPPHYIATVVGTGYRFSADVRRVPHRPLSRAAAPPSRSGNLKPPAGVLHGREDTVLSILRDLQDARLVSVVGPGGVGKTSVALAVAHAAAAGLQGGAWFVDLARLEDPALVPAAIADALRESAGPAVRSPQERDHPVLLVLDNCEHLIGAVAICADQLLARTRQVKLLTTSREPLSIRGEVVRRLAGLALPPARAGLSAQEALRFPAVQLFVERAGGPQGVFRLDDTNAAEVAAICQRLDGHALAIEHVARRVAALGIAGTLDHLARRFHMLDGHHAGPARHRTLTAAVASSYELLSAREQRLLCRLAVFEGPFGLAAAYAIGGMDDAAVVEDVGQLVAKSLLVAQAHGGEMRYRQSQLTRAFAVEQAMAHGEWASAQERLAAHLAEDAPRA